MLCIRFDLLNKLQARVLERELDRVEEPVVELDRAVERDMAQLLVYRMALERDMALLRLVVVVRTILAVVCIFFDKILISFCLIYNFNFCLN